MAGRLLAAVAAGALVVGTAAPMHAASGPSAAPQSFIVVLDSPSADVRADAASLARRAGGSVGFVYEHDGDTVSDRVPEAALGIETLNDVLALLDL